jgi:tetratricopeptide (TPR) repeat protein
VAGEYPDGQLYSWLSTARGEPADPMNVLDAFLRALGVTGAELPDTLDGRAALYRERLAGRRVLVVLDDAVHESQVRPLVPGADGCALLVTSRSCLAGLAAAHTVELDVLPPDQALAVLARLAGPERVGAEPEAAASVAAFCGGLPLALRIAGSRLATRPHWTLRQLADTLASERDRLDALAAGDVQVRASLGLSYAQLPSPERRAWRLLGLLDVPDFPAWVAAALLGRPVRDGEEIVEHLVDVHLLEVAATAPPALRYRFHDLSRLYAREQAELAESPRQRADALARLTDGYLELAGRAGQWFGPVPPAAAADWRLPPRAAERLLADPPAWLDAERAVLRALVGHAAEAGHADRAGRLAASLAGFFEVRGRFEDWRWTHERALAAGPHEDMSAHVVATLYRNLGELHLIEDFYPEAATCYERALPALRALADSGGEAAVRRGLGLVHRLQGRHAAALESFAAALALSRRAGDRTGQILDHQGASIVHLERGDLDAAYVELVRGLAVEQATGHPGGRAQLLRALGMVHLGRNELDRAGARFAEARTLSEHTGDELGAVHARQWIGLHQALTGDPGGARQTLAECLRAYQRAGNRFGQALTLRTLGDLDLCEGDHDGADASLRGSLHLWRRIGCPYWQARTLDVLAVLHRAAADPRAAADTAAQARAVRVANGLPEPVDGAPDPYRSRAERTTPVTAG